MAATGKLFSLILLSSLIWTGCRSSSSNASDSVASDQEKPPELRMEQLKVQSYEEDRLQWIMESPTAQGFTSENYMTATNLDMNLYEEGRKSTYIKANDGVLILEKNNPTQPQSPVKNIDGLPLKPGDMYLSGDVVVISTDGSKVETDWLWFHKTDKTITSTAPVKVTRADSITTGVGLEASSDLNNVKIFNQTLVIKDTKLEDEDQ